MKQTKLVVILSVLISSMAFSNLEVLRADTPVHTEQEITEEDCRDHCNDSTEIENDHYDQTYGEEQDKEIKLEKGVEETKQTLEHQTESKNTEIKKDDDKARIAERGSESNIVYRDNEYGQKIVSEIINVENRTLEVLDIPAYINGLRVVGFDDHVLNDIDKIKTLRIPAMNIPSRMFLSKEIEQLTIFSEDDITGVIGDYAFMDNPFTSLEISGIESIGNYAFKNNTYGGQQVELVALDTSLRSLDSEQPFLGLSIKSLRIPSIDIKKGAFQNYNIENLSIIKSPYVKGTLGEFAFYSQYGTKIKHLSISGIKSIEKSAFLENEITGTIVFDEDLESIGSSAFLRIISNS